MFVQYDKSTFQRINNQHNIMVLVGNGFDLALLRGYKDDRMKGKTTSYEDFYEYVKYYNLSDSDNALFRKMSEDLESGKDNWSDFELTISELVEEGLIGKDKIEQSIDEFQAHFTRFLNDLVDADLLLKINSDVQERKLAKQSLSHFIKDLDSTCKIQFPHNTNHYDLYNYVFFNFNYTSLLDNYLYLDKGQFDPHCWKEADTNFQFFPGFSFKKKNRTIWSSYLVTDIIHPHGIQSVPRSILFGIDRPKYHKGKSEEKRLIKSYWAQYDVKYKPYFDEADLFIIYGMSISMTDGWWMDQIFDAILQNGAELIIYKYGNESPDDVKYTFFEACIRHTDSPKEDFDRVWERVYVVTFEQNDTFFLGLENVTSWQEE